MMSFFASSLTQQQLRRQCAHRLGGHQPIAWSATQASVHARFAKIVAEHADRVAIEAADGTLRYAELNRAANRIARCLQQRLGSGPPEPVGILMHHGAAPLVAIMGVLKAGHIYLGLDPLDPPLRLRQIIEHAGLRLLLVQAGTQRQAEEAVAGLRQGVLVLPVEELPAATGDEPGREVAATSPASIYYTSGSTGQPKGVLYSHHARMVTALRNTNGIQISRFDRLSLTYPSRYAGATNHTFGALLNGACVLPFDYVAEGPARLAEFLDRQQITLYHSVPAMFRQMLLQGAPELRFAAMRLLLLSSDSVYPADLAEFSRRFPPRCLFSNSWGLSESPLFRPCFFAPLASTGAVDGVAELPTNLAAIGAPLEEPEEEDEVLLLDAEGKPVAAGEAGEIVVRSRFFALGYWQDPEQTAARFRPDPVSPDHRLYFTGDLGRANADGTIVHLGRKDFQVQIGGERVEVAEIEAVLLQRPDLQAAVVVAQPGASGELRLIAYVVCVAAVVANPPWESNLRDYVGERLPRQMTPDRFVFLPALPLTAAGKVNRRALPQPSRLRPPLRTPFEAPATPLEAALVAAFGEILELDGLGVRDSFLELGGKSLGAMRLLARVQQEHGVRITLAEFFPQPTPIALAACVELALLAELPEELLQEVEGLTEEEARRLLSEG